MIEKIRTQVRRKRQSDRGATAAEYALIMGLVVAVLITILLTFGPRIAQQFDKACTQLNGNVSCQ
jgi:Flp pilus assembly pilin Flp